MKCLRCLDEINGSARYCEHCGYKVYRPGEAAVGPSMGPTLVKVVQTLVLALVVVVAGVMGAASILSGSLGSCGPSGHNSQHEMLTGARELVVAALALVGMVAVALRRE